MAEGLARAPRIARLALRIGLLTWAGFWAWFVAAASLGELPRPPWWIPLAWFGALIAATWSCWKLPLLGGLTMLGAGVWSAFYFAHPAARALLAAPALALGLGFVTLGVHSRRQRPAD